MKIGKLLWIAGEATLLQIAAASGAWAQTLSLSGDPFSLDVHTAVAGFAPQSVTETSTTYAVTVPSSGAALKARLNAPVPSGVQLRISVQAPSGAATVGELSLSTTDQTVVMNLPQGSHSALGITYRLVASASAGVIAPASREIVFTIVQNP
jgi:hypothetical protein